MFEQKWESTGRQMKGFRSEVLLARNRFVWPKDKKNPSNPQDFPRNFMRSRQFVSFLEQNEYFADCFEQPPPNNPLAGPPGTTPNKDILAVLVTLAGLTCDCETEICSEACSRNADSFWPPPDHIVTEIVALLREQITESFEVSKEVIATVKSEWVERRVHEKQNDPRNTEIVSEPVFSEKLNKEKVKTPAPEGTNQPVHKKLSPLRERDFVSEEVFLKNLKKQIGDTGLTEYGELILKHGKIPLLDTWVRRAPEIVVAYLVGWPCAPAEPGSRRRRTAWP